MGGIENDPANSGFSRLNGDEGREAKGEARNPMWS